MKQEHDKPEEIRGKYKVIPLGEPIRWGDMPMASRWRRFKTTLKHWRNKLRPRKLWKFDVLGEPKYIDPKFLDLD